MVISDQIFDTTKKILLFDNNLQGHNYDWFCHLATLMMVQTR